MEEKITEKKDKSLALRKEGYNCAQCVLMTLAPLVNLDEETATRICSGLGSGVGGSGQICGAANAMALAESCLHGTAPTDKAEAMKDVRRLLDRFSSENGDRINCCDLKGKEGVRPCAELIRQAVGIFCEAHPELLADE